ncbi:MAG: DNA repair protein RadC [Gammaproteobacteria bacterium]|nr:DNA repair protein RadC [Gammaproteobacteria bacterium]
MKKGGKAPLYDGHRRRLRERFRKGGLAGFADYEVIEMLLTLAIPRGDTKPAAKALLARFGGLRGVLDAPLADLQSVKGVGEVAAASLRLVRAVATLYLQQASERTDVLEDPDRLSDFWRAKLGMLKHEVFAVAYVDSAGRLLRDGIEVLQEGTIDRAAVYPRRVVESALRHQAAGLVLAHNHPNGNVQPSEHDKLITRAIVLAAETVSLRILDHVIVSQQETFSFRSAGLL